MERQTRRVVITPLSTAVHAHVLAALLDAQAANFDEWQVWTHESTRALEVLDAVRAGRPWLTVIEQPRAYRVGPSLNISQCYDATLDPDTLYCRVPDTVTWLHPEFCKRVFEAREAWPDSVLVYATRLATRPAAGTPPNFPDDFPDETLATFEARPLEAVAWSGRVFGWFRGKTPADDETWLGHEYPWRTGRPNVVCGGALYTAASHDDEAAWTPVVAEPVVAEPVVAEPVVAEPVVAEPVTAEPVTAEPSRRPLAEPVPPPTKKRASRRKATTVAV